MELFYLLHQTLGGCSSDLSFSFGVGGGGDTCDDGSDRTIYENVVSPFFIFIFETLAGGGIGVEFVVDMHVCAREERAFPPPTHHHHGLALFCPELTAFDDLASPFVLFSSRSLSPVLFLFSLSLLCMSTE